MQEKFIQEGLNQNQIHVKIIPCEKGLKFFRDEVVELKQQLQISTKKERTIKILKKLESCLNSNYNIAKVWGLGPIVDNIIGLITNQCQHKDDIIDLLEKLLEEQQELINSPKPIVGMYDQFYSKK